MSRLDEINEELAKLEDEIERDSQPSRCSPQESGHISVQVLVPFHLRNGMHITVQFDAKSADTRSGTQEREA